MTFQTAADVVSALNLRPAEDAAPFVLAVGHVTLTVRAPEPLRAALVDYFRDALTDAPGALTVDLLPGQTLADDPGFEDWAREPGKAGRKDAICDLTDARLIKKVRSGVTFLQSKEIALAFGPLDNHLSTVINFINTQLLNACQRDAWEICHAAAVTDGTRGLAIAGLSGGGKSTSILRLMDLDTLRFVSNDRLLVRGGTQVQGLGIPKHPRINPGTILGNPRLTPMLSEARRAALLAMAVDDLWELEEKHDLMIPDIYGTGRLQYEMPVTDFWVLNWARDVDRATELHQVQLEDRPDLLGAIMKSAGPFYQRADGSFLPNGDTPAPAGYLAALRGVRVMEVTGRVDFDAIAKAGRELFGV